MSLSLRTFFGFFWSFGQLSSIYIINFVTLVVLSRFLSPEIFGIVALIQVFISIGNVLADSGMSSSLIRSKELGAADYSSVFAINVVAGLTIYLFLFLLAPFVAVYYEQPLLTDVIRVLAVSCVLQALSAVFIARMTREMQFRKQFLLQLPASLIASAISIYLAKNDWGVWSLVWLNIVRTFLVMLLSWSVIHIKIFYRFSREVVRQHFNFGSKITVVGILNAIYSNLYNMVIGKNFNVATVGLFHQANTLSLLPVDMLSTALDKVTYPAFSSIQDEETRLRTVYRKVMQQAIFWCCPLMLFLMANAEPVFRIVFTEKWLAAAPFFEILCLYGLLHPLQVYNVNILKVKGRSDLLLRIEVIKKTIGIVGVIGIVTFGIYALLWFKVFYGLFLFYVNTLYSGKMIGYRLMNQVRDVVPIFALGAFITGLEWAIHEFVFANSLSDWSKIAIDIILFGGVYLIVAAAIKLEPWRDFILLVSGLRRKKMAS